MIEGLKVRTVSANTIYHNSRVVHEAIVTSGATSVFPSNPTRKLPCRLDRRRCWARNHIERCFNKLIHFRRIASRYDRRAIYFLTSIRLAAAISWIRRMSIQHSQVIGARRSILYARRTFGQLQRNLRGAVAN